MFSFKSNLEAVWKQRNRLWFVSGLFLFCQCQSRPHTQVQLGEAFPPASCQEIGQVIGNSSTHENAQEQAMDDLRYNAAQLEGNYVRVIAVSAHGTAARGIAYRCR